MIPVYIDIDGRPYTQLELEASELPSKDDVVEFSAGGTTFSGKVLTVTKQYGLGSALPGTLQRRLQSAHLSLGTAL